MVPKTTEQMVAIFRDLPLQWTPGEKYAYNNSGYFLLGVVIEKVTGKKYEQALQEMILTPLGLKDTGYDWPGTILPQAGGRLQGPRQRIRNAAPLDMQQPYSAGALYSTVGDLLKWDQALYTDKLLPAGGKEDDVDAVQGRLRLRLVDRAAVSRPPSGTSGSRTAAASTASRACSSACPT